MRLLHVIDSRQLRGAEIFASDLIRALNGAGVAQRVAVIPGGLDRSVQYDAPIHSLGTEGWNVPVLHFRPPALRAIRSLIGKWQPDVVQAHGGHSHKYTMMASLRRRTAVVYRKIGLTPPGMSSFFSRAGHGYLMRRTPRIIAVAESVRLETMRTFRVAAEHVITIPNAVDPRRMKTVKGAQATRRALGIPQDSPVILSLGALTWEKDPAAHVEIGARVVRQLPESVHIIVGDGPLRSQVEASIRSRRLDGRLRLLSARADVPDLLAMSNVLLLASRTEGMPGSLIEAGMMGLPVAAYAVGGVQEVVVDGVTGRLTTGGDVEGLAGRVLQLLTDREASRAMGEAAKERCGLWFNIDSIAPKYLKVYEELLA